MVGMKENGWETVRKVLKVAMVMAVAVAGSMVVTYGHTPMEQRVCLAIIAAGAALGIGSSGIRR